MRPTFSVGSQALIADPQNQVPPVSITWYTDQQAPAYCTPASLRAVAGRRAACLLSPCPTCYASTTGPTCAPLQRYEREHACCCRPLETRLTFMPMLSQSASAFSMPPLFFLSISALFSLHLSRHALRSLTCPLPSATWTATPPSATTRTRRHSRRLGLSSQRSTE